LAIFLPRPSFFVILHLNNLCYTAWAFDLSFTCGLPRGLGADKDLVHAFLFYNRISHVT